MFDGNRLNSASSFFERHGLQPSLIAPFRPPTACARRGLWPSTRLSAQPPWSPRACMVTILLYALLYGQLLQLVAASTVTTLTGDGTAAKTDGVGTNAQHKSPGMLTLTPDGTRIISTELHSVRQVVLSSATVTTLAGTTTAGHLDATGATARFNYPMGVAISSNGLNIYVADSYNHRIRQLVLSSTAVTTFAGSGSAGSADGVGVLATFDYPYDVCISADGTKLFVADRDNNIIRQIVISTTAVTTIAGSGTAAFADGTGNAASFNSPLGLAMNNDATLYVADFNNHRIRQVAVATGAVSTLAGSGSEAHADGTGNGASFAKPWGVGVGPDGATLYVAAPGSDRVRDITIATGVVGTVAGSGTQGFAECARRTLSNLAHTTSSA